MLSRVNGKRHLNIKISMMAEKITRNVINAEHLNSSGGRFSPQKYNRPENRDEGKGEQSVSEPSMLDAELGKYNFVSTKW